MEKTLFYPLLTFIFLVTLVGGWIPTVRIWSQSTFQMIISFCAGILLGAVFFHIFPHITGILGDKVGYPIMIGFFLIFLLEKFIMVHPCEEGECNFHKIGMAAYFGIGFHSILDGVAMGAGSLMNLSLILFVAIAIHKFPAALALSSLLVKGGEYSRQKILTSMFIFALTTPLGAVLSLSLLKTLDPYIVAVALGISAGTFLFISTADLLPSVYIDHEKKEYRNLVSLCLGILVMILSRDIF